MDLYMYKAHCDRVIDGDTINISISLGMNVSVNARVRLAGINTPETYGVKKDSEEYKAGLLAKEEVERLILDKNIIIRTEKDKTGKYGRYIAHIYTTDDTEVENIEELSLNTHLVKKGFAVSVNY